MERLNEALAAASPTDQDPTPPLPETLSTSSQMSGGPTQPMAEDSEAAARKVQRDLQLRKNAEYEAARRSAKRKLQAQVEAKEIEAELASGVYVDYQAIKKRAWEEEEEEEEASRGGSVPPFGLAPGNAASSVDIWGGLDLLVSPHGDDDDNDDEIEAHHSYVRGDDIPWATSSGGGTSSHGGASSWESKRVQSFFACARTITHIVIVDNRPNAQCTQRFGGRCSSGRRCIHSNGHVLSWWWEHIPKLPLLCRY